LGKKKSRNDNESILLYSFLLGSKVIPAKLGDPQTTKKPVIPALLLSAMVLLALIQT